MNFDIAIIGGGPAGYTAAERAGANGLRAVLFEKKAIGGVCLNEGCIPTKTLLYSAKILDSIKSASKYGISAESPSFDLTKIMSRKEKTVKMLTGGVKMTVNSYGVTIVEKEAFIEGEENGLIRIICDGERYEVKYLLVCTGSDTVIPPIPGLSEVSYWTSKEALEIKELPETLVVIGGGVIGMEFASFFNSMGVKVHVVEMMPEILGVMDKETSSMLRMEYAKRGVTFYLNTKVIEVKPDGVVIEKDGKASTIKTEKILLSVGRKANITNVGLDKLNIELHRNGVKVDEYLQTSHPGVYACGDITGYSLLAHTAIREAEVAINHILGVEDRMNYNSVPGVVYTNPEVAGVGKTEEELTKQGIPYRVTKLPMAYSGRFVAENEQVNGICKLILDEADHIIGCHMLGNPASELIVIAGIAIRRAIRLRNFRRMYFPILRLERFIMRCFHNTFTDIYFHLAAEEYLLKQETDSVFMLWQDTPSVVMGKHQSVQLEVNREWAEEQQIQIARRFSGGGAVYHDLGNVNLTFIETVSRLPDFSLYLHRILDFLKLIGLPAKGDERLGIYLDGLKISGSAQCVHKNRVLYHCTLLYDTNLAALNKVLNPERDIETGVALPVYAVPSVRSEVTNISRYLPMETVDHFKAILFEYFSQKGCADTFSEKELEAIHKLRTEKYICEDWIFSR